jgi:SAM-dependent methyltransferase
MNRHFKTVEDTIRYYDEHADEYVRNTVAVEMESLYGPFLNLIPDGGKILDAGCGSGRDTKAFLERGYEVVAIDASEAMAKAASNLTGLPASVLQIQDIKFQDEFDGIWACASLLHIPRAELDDVLCRFRRALRSAGVCYASFKEGKGDRVEEGRLFTDFTQERLRDYIRSHTTFEIEHLWVAEDVRQRRNVRWVNVLLRNSVKGTCGTSCVMERPIGP